MKSEIEMIETLPVAPDGLKVEIWSKGSRHFVNDDLLAILIGAGAVALVEHKAQDAAPENKALMSAPSKKRRKRK